MILYRPAWYLRLWNYRSLTVQLTQGPIFLQIGTGTLSLRRQRGYKSRLSVRMLSSVYNCTRHPCVEWESHGSRVLVASQSRRVAVVTCNHCINRITRKVAVGFRMGNFLRAIFLRPSLFHTSVQMVLRAALKRSGTMNKI